MDSLAVSRKYKNWSCDQWDKVIFSDEALFGTSAKRLVRRQETERYDEACIMKTILVSMAANMRESSEKLKGKEEFSCEIFTVMSNIFSIIIYKMVYETILSESFVAIISGKRRSPQASETKVTLSSMDPVLTRKICDLKDVVKPEKRSETK
ncbi:Hypothetical predicted protein [Octopus vulgaris]|uniref:Uncharacterized protein n=1 Tax=Octopus vulgaris TaxID=6645 RepID=A0AA36APA7_OCTVU|nr:Hypothetical predicted protein [Octopus vulgaris]